jgi:DNA primase
MQKPSRKQRKALERAVTSYQTALHLATGFLEKRGVTATTAEAFRLGVVDTPEPGHEQFTGRLAIPYIDKLGVYGLTFRCLAHEDCKAADCGAKFLSLPGQEKSLYNILAADSTHDTAHIVEGEPDTWVVSQVFSEPVLGVPGAGNWRPWWWMHLSGFERVIMWPDGDVAGRKLVEKVQASVRNVEVMSIPTGLDVGELFLREGANFLHKMAGAIEGEETD